jgi:SAM-dependent methyltransferase
MLDSNKLEREIYSAEFYKSIGRSSKRSAEAIVPMVLERVPCNRVIDVGCGDGTWLKVFQEYGVREILGIDGSYVDENILVISKDEFKPFDLKQPLRLEESFDLVISLEVAEHLPPESAEIFINSLTHLGSVILFSAAIPHQPGDNHINTQWLPYWIELFKNQDYVAIDCIRQQIWNHPDVAFWFAQNILFFVQKNKLNSYPALQKEFEETNLDFISLVHPNLYLKMIQQYSKDIQSLKSYNDPTQMSLKVALKNFPIILGSAVKRQINRFLSFNP